MNALTAMPHARVIDAPPRLRLEDAALNRLETPCYVFDPAIAVARHAALREALGTPLVVSIKANPNIDMYVRCGPSFSDGIELASIGELNLVVGRAATPKFVTSPAMDAELLSSAVASRATVILDSLDQLEMLLGLTSGFSHPARVGLRLNAASLVGLPAGSAQADHFGMDLASAREACGRLASAGLSVAGLHVYAGSYSFETMSTALAWRAGGILALFEDLAPRPLEFLNLGGGFSEDWHLSEGLAEYRGLVERLQRRITIYHEAGRAIYADCGAFAAKVVAVKRLGDRAFVVCDGGMAQAFLLAQTERVIKKRRRPRLVRNTGRPDHHGVSSVQVVGNSCNREDVIGELAPEDLPSIGDLLVFDRCGAYHTYAPNGFLSLRPPGRFIIS